MRILVISIVDPVTFRGGAGTATRGMLRLLSSEPIGAEIECLPSVTPNSRLARRLRQAVSVLASFVSRLPSKAIYQRSGGFAKTVRARLVQRDYDLVLINGCDLIWVLDEVPAGVPVLVWAHNLEHELYARQIETMPLRAITRRFLAADLAKLRRFEIDGLRRADGTMFLSSTEAARMKPHLRERAPLVVPPIFHGEPEPRRPHRRGPKLDVGFLANFGWWPNLDGLRWFLEEIFPRCRVRIRLHLFGTGSDYFSGYAAGVSAHGFVQHTSTIWDTCDVMVCPIRAGGGVNVKLAEALFNGVPVLATPHAVKGLSLVPGDALAVATDARAWIEFINSDALEALASAKVSRDDRDIFRADTHADAVAAYLAGILEKAG